jgi:hypothetical protein
MNAPPQPSFIPNMKTLPKRVHLRVDAGHDTGETPDVTKISRRIPVRMWHGHPAREWHGRPAHEMQVVGHDTGETPVPPQTLESTRRCTLPKQRRHGGLAPLLGLLLLGLAYVPSAVASPPPAPLTKLSGKKVWDGGIYNAFTDLTHFGGRWLCCFREGVAHNREQGNIRIVASRDGETWESVSFLRSKDPVDLRDPKFALMPDGRLMLVVGGSALDGDTVVEKHSLVAFSSDGENWSPFHRVLKPNHWLWRVTWFGSVAYGYAYLRHEGAREGFLVESRDGINWRYVKQLDLPYASEATIRFLDSGEMIMLARTEPESRKPVARIGSSKPPYTDWTWNEVPYHLGGPNFIVLPDGRWVAGTRLHNVDGKGGRSTGLAWMTRDSLTPFAQFETVPREAGYPGLVWKDGRLWVTYYSDHEGQTNIYIGSLPLK